MARRMVRRVRHAERRATHGRPRPAHSARGRPCDYDHARVEVVAGEWDAFSMERVACNLFGVVTYGVHMTVYEQQKGEVVVDAN